MKILLMILLVGCGAEVKHETKTAEPCSVTSLEDGALITCPDGSQSFISNGVKGDQGEDGINGYDGSDAKECSVEETAEGAKITCGDKSVIVNNGSDGKDGSAGVDGIDGTDAKPCEVLPTDTGVKIVCGSSVAYINNGSDGADGINGSPGENGSDGKDGGCSVTRYKESAKITCTDGTETIIDFPTVVVKVIKVKRIREREK